MRFALAPKRSAAPMLRPPTKSATTVWADGLSSVHSSTNAVANSARAAPVETNALLVGRVNRGRLGRVRDVEDAMNSVYTAGPPLQDVRPKK